MKDEMNTKKDVESKPPLGLPPEKINRCNIFGADPIIGWLYHEFIRDLANDSDFLKGICLIEKNGKYDCPIKIT